MPLSQTQWLRGFATLAGLAVVGWLVWRLRAVLSPVFLAWLIAYLLDPVVDRFEAWKLPRVVGIVAVLAGFIAVVALFALLAVPAIVEDVASFARELPGRLTTLRDRAEPWLAAQGVTVPHSFDELVRSAEAESITTSAASYLGKLLSFLAGETASLVSAVVGALIVPILAFYLLHDFDHITRAVRELVPHRVRPLVVEVAQEIDEVIGQFVRGQSLVMLILAVLYGTAFSLLGVRLALVIGLVGGLLAFIPYVGGAIAIGLALLMCLLDGAELSTFVWVIAAYAAIQTFDGFVITPKVVGEKVGLPAVAVLLALMIGGELLGFLGVLLAVPAAAVVKILVVRALVVYRKSAVFRDGAPAADPPAAEHAAEPPAPEGTG